MASIAIKDDAVELIPDDLWALICILTVRDHKAGRLGVCENPTCPACYFVKKRKTQKFCEGGPCVAYKQRKYALESWHRVGSKKREEKRKRAKLQERKRKKP